MSASQTPELPALSQKVTDAKARIRDEAASSGGYYDTADDPVKGIARCNPTSDTKGPSKTMR